MIASARQIIQRESGRGRLAKWTRVYASAASAVLIAGAIVIVFLAGFSQTSAPLAPSPASVKATIVERAPLLPKPPACLASPHQKCKKLARSGAHPTAIPSLAPAG